MCPPSAYRPMSTSSPRTATAEVRFAATRLIGRSTHTLLFPIALRRFAHPSRHARNELPTIAMGRRHHPLRCLRTRPMTTNPYNNHEPVQQLRTRQTTTNPFNDFGPLRRRRTCPTTTNPSDNYTCGGAVDFGGAVDPRTTSSHGTMWRSTCTSSRRSSAKSVKMTSAS